LAQKIKPAHPETHKYPKVGSNLFRDVETGKIFARGILPAFIFVGGLLAGGVRKSLKATYSNRPSIFYISFIK
jgi:hypothetical protein